MQVAERFQSKQMSNIIILGAQWGDEGKGKLVDLLADRFDIVVRYQGGHNAGHTILIGDRKFVLRLVPSGILHPGKSAVIGNGLVVDPLGAAREKSSRWKRPASRCRDQLRISNRAQVLLPSHRLMEKMSERGRADPIGTTSRGIGPCYEDKAGAAASAWPTCSTATISRAVRRAGGEKDDHRAGFRH